MTPEREKLIRELWENNKHLWPAGHPRFSVQVPIDISIDYAEYERQAAHDWTTPLESVTVTFEIERQNVDDGLILRRVVCEGLPLTKWSWKW